MFPLPTCPLAGQAELWQNTVCGSIWRLLVDLADQTRLCQWTPFLPSYALSTIRWGATQTVALRFKTDFRVRYQIVEVSERLVDLAMTLAEKHGLRGYDSVQLSAAVELQAVRDSLSLAPVTFVCADERLGAAAAAEQLLVENPNEH